MGVRYGGYAAEECIRMKTLYEDVRMSIKRLATTNLRIITDLQQNPAAGHWLTTVSESQHLIGVSKLKGEA